MRILILAAALFACCQTPAPAPTATPAQACARLQELGCEEAGDDCVAVTDHILATGIIRYDVACVAAATSREAVRLCPGVTCP